jgi:hypothetical protein
MCRDLGARARVRSGRAKHPGMLHRPRDGDGRSPIRVLATSGQRGTTRSRIARARARRRLVTITPRRTISTRSRSTPRVR